MLARFSPAGKNCGNVTQVLYSENVFRRRDLDQGAQVNLKKVWNPSSGPTILTAWQNHRCNMNEVR